MGNTSTNKLMFKIATLQFSPQQQHRSTNGLSEGSKTMQMHLIFECFKNELKFDIKLKNKK